jgi:hypothetical protein
MYAHVSWNAMDIQDRKPEWTLEQCEEFLDSIEEDVRDCMIERGWDLIDDKLNEIKESV